MHIRAKPMRDDSRAKYDLQLDRDSKVDLPSQHDRSVLEATVAEIDLSKRPNPPERRRSIPWVVKSALIGMIAAVVMAVALIVESAAGRLVLTAGVLTFVVSLCHNPIWWHRRAASVLIGAWVVQGIALGLQIRVNDWVFVGSLGTSQQWAFLVGTPLMVVVLLVLDVRLRHRKVL